MKVNRALYFAAALLLSFFTQVIQAQAEPAPVETGNTEIYEGLVIGLGKGTVIVILFSIIGMLFCLFRDCSQTPNCCVFIGILIPLLVLLLIMALPKKSLETDKKKLDLLPSDNYVLWKLLITIAMSLVVLALCCVLLGTNLSLPLIAQRTDSSEV